MPSPSRSTGRRAFAGAVAGVDAAAAFAAVMEVDRRLFKRDTDDLVLLGRFVSAQRTQARAAGLGIHLANGVILGGFYGVALHEVLPGAPMMRGVIFANAENLILYPLALLENYHPAIRDGEIGGYWNGTAFIQEVLRHVVFGAILGDGTERILQSDR